MIENFETVVLTFQFLVPGYIIREIIIAIYPQKHFSEGEKIIQMMAYSVLNTAVWYGPILYIQNKFSHHSTGFWLCSIGCILLTGCATGIFLGFARKKEWFKKLLEWIKLEPLHPAPTAWDYFFSKMESCWVEVKVSDGKVVRGYYSCDSLTSSDNSYHDIYVEKLYVKRDGSWEKVERTKGVWINPDEIRYIKFYSEEE